MQVKGLECATFSAYHPISMWYQHRISQSATLILGPVDYGPTTLPLRHLDLEPTFFIYHIAFLTFLKFN
jgi:hypothetical protein